MSLFLGTVFAFYTGKERKASDILSSQNEQTKKGDESVVTSLDKIKEIGLETRNAFEKGDIDGFGELLDLHWNTKKRLSSRVSDPFIDECYEEARRNGALGGKIMGAGGGGFFMFYCPREKRKLTEILEKKSPYDVHADIVLYVSSSNTEDKNPIIGVEMIRFKPANKDCFPSLVVDSCG